MDDPDIARLVPYRLELVNGADLVKAVRGVHVPEAEVTEKVYHAVLRADAGWVQGSVLWSYDVPRILAAKIEEAFKQAWHFIAEAGHADDLTKDTRPLDADDSPPFAVVLTTHQDFGLAETKETAASMRFDYQRVCDLPDPTWPVLIVAHELAHVWLYVTKDPTHLEKRPSDADLIAAWNVAREECVPTTS